MLYKASSKSKLGEGKKQSRLGLVVYGFKEDSEGKPVRYKKSDNSKTKSGRYNKWPQLKSVTSVLVEDNKSKLAVPKKLNSCKANPNRHRKRPQLELVVGTLTENSNNEPVVCKRQLVKGRYNLSAYKPILAGNSSTREIAIDNSKSL